MTGIANTGMQSPAPQQTKTAHRMLQRQPDGSLKSVLIDDNTGQPVSNPAGYNVTDGFFSDLSSLGLNPTNGVGATSGTGANMQSTAQKVINPEPSGGQDHGLNSDHAGGRAAARDETNNFGYINKPTALSVASALPGALGLGAKAASVGINANNLAATNTAREELGLPDTTGMAAAKSVAMNNQGQVANIGLNGQNYSVGLAAMSPTGQTNLTPAEARERSLVTHQPITELSPSEAQAQQASFKASNPSVGPFNGPFGGLLNGAKSFVDNLFLDPAQKFISNTFNPNLNTFPNAPTADHSGGGYQGTSSGSDGYNSGTTTGNNANTNGQGGSSIGAQGRSEGDGNFGNGGNGGLSPGAQNAIDHGQGGLY